MKSTMTSYLVSFTEEKIYPQF